MSRSYQYMTHPAVWRFTVVMLGLLLMPGLLLAQTDKLLTQPLYRPLLLKLHHKLATHQLRLATLGAASHRLTADLIKTTDGKWRPRMALWVDGKVQRQFSEVSIVPIWPAGTPPNPKAQPQGFRISATDGDY